MRASTLLPKEKLFQSYFITFYNVFASWCKNVVRRGGNFKQFPVFGREPSARLPDPKAPDFSLQKVVPPPAKMCKKWGFLGEKACIFGQFVHNFAQSLFLFFADIAPLQGCQSVRKKNPPIYTVLNAAFFGPDPRLWHRGGTPSSRRALHGLRRQILQNSKKRVFKNTFDKWWR